MQFIDTHSHLYLSQFSDDINEVVQRAISKEIVKIVLPNIDSESIAPNNKLAHSNPDLFVPLMGLHPTYVKDDFEEKLNIILEQFDKQNYAGVGEIGIDLYWDKTHYPQQRIAFIKQVEFAIENKLPFIVHARNSFNEIIDALKSINKEKYYGIFHAFTGTEAQARQVIEMGFKIGLGGILTFKNSGLKKEVKNIDLNHIVLETDSPYLAPSPHRGKRNESAYVTLVAEKLAEIKNVTLNEVAAKTTANAQQIFKL